MSAEWGTPPFRDLQYCLRCCMPATNEGVAFDEFGVCQACQSSEQKMRIDWTLREKATAQHPRQATAARTASNYDCIVPISGGKDSTFQLHVLTKVYGLRPLAVTFSHNWFSETGRYNLENALERFDVDHIEFTPNRALVNKLARQSLCTIGDSCWHCHAGVGAFPLQVAVRWNIPLLIWGESIAETSGRATYLRAGAQVRPRVLPQASRPRSTPTRWSARRHRARGELRPFELPSAEELRGGRPARHPPRRLPLLGRRAPDGVRTRHLRLAGGPRRGHLQGLQERRVPHGRRARLHEVPQARLRPRHRPRQRGRARRA